MQIKRLKNKKAYSLLEVIVTLAITSIIIVMLTNILLLSLDISKKSFIRASIREEQSKILLKIEKDIKNSILIDSCSGENETALCEVTLDKKYYWALCDDGNLRSICKKINLNTPNEQIVEKLPDYINVNYISFEQAPSEDLSKKTIVVTLSFSYKDETYGINDLVRQVIVSTRNYGY